MQFASTQNAARMENMRRVSTASGGVSHACTNEAAASRMHLMQMGNLLLIGAAHTALEIVVQIALD